MREIQVFQQGVPFDIPEFGFGFAAGLPATSSSDVVDSVNDDRPLMSVDNCYGTYWLNVGSEAASNYDPHPWWSIDLQEQKTIQFMRLGAWEQDFQYSVQISNDNSNWTTVWSAGNPGKNQIQDISLDAPVEGRYVKLATGSDTPDGTYTEFSLRSVEIAGPEGWLASTTSLDGGPTATPDGGGPDSATNADQDTGVAGSATLPPDRSTDASTESPDGAGGFTAGPAPFSGGCSMPPASRAPLAAPPLLLLALGAVLRRRRRGSPRLD